MEQKPIQQKPVEHKPTPVQSADFRHLVRIANTDLDGNKAIFHAMRKIKGISFTYSNAVCSIANVSQEKKAGVLSDTEISKLDEIIRNPKKYNIPTWILNRRKDYDTGEDKHLITSDLTFTTENDIRMMKKIRCYKGVRHMLGLPVRGQRMRSNFRKNKGKVLGVKKPSRVGKT